VSSSRPTEPAPGGPPPRRKPFLQQSYGDMVRSMVLLVLLVALVYGCTRLLSPDTEPSVTTIDYTSQLRSAQELAEYEVLAPRGLPEQWRATSADLDRSGDEVSWELGFLSPEERFVGLEQTDGELDAEVARLFEGRQADGTVSAAGRRWQVFRGGTDGDSALVHVDGAVTTVVRGSPDVETLRTFADSLG